MPLLFLVAALIGFVWPIRPSSTYRPRYPINSWRRPGYGKQRPYNPNGWHQATDFDIDTNDELVQLPWKSKIWWKGTYGDLGRVLEVRIAEGRYSGKFMRFCHLRSYINKPYGYTLPAGYAVAHADNTGNSSGSHLHVEMGDHPLREARFPKIDFYPYALDAYQNKRWRP